MPKVLPPTYLLAAIALTIAAHLLLPIVRLIPSVWRLLGFLPIAAGIGLNIAADRLFKSAETTVKPLQRSTALVTSGVFGWSRNPMYLGMVLILSGVAILEGSLTPWIVVAALAVLLDSVFITPEERMLAETFGAAFELYKRQVRRWL